MSVFQYISLKDNSWILFLFGMIEALCVCVCVNNSFISVFKALYILHTITSSFRSVSFMIELLELSCIQTPHITRCFRVCLVCSYFRCNCFPSLHLFGAETRLVLYRISHFVDLADCFFKGHSFMSCISNRLGVKLLVGLCNRPFCNNGNVLYLLFIK